MIVGDQGKPKKRRYTENENDEQKEGKKQNQSSFNQRPFSTTNSNGNCHFLPLELAADLGAVPRHLCGEGPGSEAEAGGKLWPRAVPFRYDLARHWCDE